ncbi:FAD-dependent monooxygenase [Saccharothrix sp. HUAS TT1]|uniref:FAD-dependent monooxygenase n=1 Tax=unclassified Saccharothrix TaxID=2593673 RepID=UPI00345B9CE2
MVDRTSVLIVGAGPCGLTAACELLRAGVPVRVVEASEEPHTGSRAIQLWPPALEIFRGLGFLDEALERGVKVRTMAYHLAGRKRLDVVLGRRNEPLLLRQEETSRLLEETFAALGGVVERGLRVVDVVNGADSVTVKVDSPRGVEVVEADWLIAADGVRSTVRERLGVDFPGERVGATLLLAEGRVDGPLDAGAVHYFLGRTGSLVFARMAGGRTRVSAAIPADAELSPEFVQSLLDERGPGGLVVRDLDTLTTFSSSERIAARLRLGRCFLVGDAAHTHSPLGGQGLNLGLQDVHNLTWKLAGVVTGKLGEAVLDTYEPERRQAAEQVVSTTSRMIKVFTVGPFAARVRNGTWGLLQATGALRRWFVPLMAGWRTPYPDTLGWGGAKWLPAPGTRAPHWVPPSADRAFRLVTAGPRAGALAKHAASAAAAHPDLAHHHVHRPTAGFLLVRPDGYVAASGRTAAALRAACDKLERAS